MKADLTQEQLGEKAGVSGQTVLNAEAGKGIQDLSAQRIATALGIEVDELEAPDLPVPLTPEAETELVREVKESAKESA